jgi:hypothetical protein
MLENKNKIILLFILLIPSCNRYEHGRDLSYKILSVVKQDALLYSCTAKNISGKGIDVHRAHEKTISFQSFVNKNDFLKIEKDFSDKKIFFLKDGAVVFEICDWSEGISDHRFVYLIYDPHGRQAGFELEAGDNQVLSFEEMGEEGWGIINYRNSW